jgi:hypothetical protein
MFCTLKSRNFAWLPNFITIFANCSPKEPLVRRHGGALWCLKDSLDQHPESKDETRKSARKSSALGSLGLYRTLSFRQEKDFRTGIKQWQHQRMVRPSSAPSVKLPDSLHLPPPLCLSLSPSLSPSVCVCVCVCVCVRLSPTI